MSGGIITRDTSLSPGAKRQYVLPMNNPAVVPVLAADHMRPDDVVACILVHGRARAYPWWIISNYHVINDTMMASRPSEVPKGCADWNTLLQTKPEDELVPVPILLVICEACAGTSAFLPVTEGYDRPLSFTFCERTANSYSARGIYTISDMQTQSRWHPLTGIAQEGTFSGKRLHRVPVHTYSWSDWISEFPEGEVVLAGDEMRHRTHVEDLPHPLDREAGHSDMLKALRDGDEGLDQRIPAGELILGLSDGQNSVAITHTYLALSGEVKNATWMGIPVLLMRHGKFSALAFHREHTGQVLEFRPIPGKSGTMLDQLGRRWSTFGTCLSDSLVANLAVYQGSYSTKWGDWSFAHPATDVVTEYNISSTNEVMI